MCYNANNKPKVFTYWVKPIFCRKGTQRTQKIGDLLQFCLCDLCDLLRQNLNYSF